MNGRRPEPRDELWSLPATASRPNWAKMYGDLFWMTALPNRIKPAATTAKEPPEPAHNTPVTAHRDPVTVALPINEGRFRDRPVDALLALLPSQEQALTAYRAVRGAGLDTAGAYLLAGPDGARILDRFWTRPRRGRHHPPDLRTLGYFDVMLGLYASGLRGHGALLVLPGERATTGPITQMLHEHGAQHLSYVGTSTLEGLTAT